MQISKTRLHRIVPSKNRGFTLSELMIVVAIIAILAAVAYPQYAQYVKRSKRAEGRAALMDAAARLERFYSDNNRYATADDTIHGNTGISATTENGYYELSIATSGTYQTYVLSAAPLAPFTDPECGTLTITQAGTKGESGTLDVADCWGK